MLPLNLKGDTLGQRHFNLNKITNEAFKNNVDFGEIINLKEESQVDRLFKIDLANKQRNVDFIIENIKSANSLYFSRALHNTWLFRDNKYAHIVNPQYLHETLFHQMTNKAISKFLLQLRLNLKDKKRCEDFYTYYCVTGNEDAAKKILPKCSEDFILLQLKAERHEIDEHMFKLLCETSLKVIDVVLPKIYHYSLWNYIKAINFIATTETDIYFNLLDKYLDTNVYGTLSKRTTNAILRKYKSKVLSDTKFCQFLDLSTLGKHLSQTELKELLIRLSKDPERSSSFNIDHVSPLLKYLKRDERFDFVKSLFEQRHTNEIKFRFMSARLCSSGGNAKSVSASNVYQCYRFAEFKTAFPELKKLIRTESSTDERLAMLKVILTACRNNQSNILILLQYFHDRHINEPRNFKMKFLRTFLKSSNAVKCDDKCWSVLNEIFHNCGVYEESCDDAQICVDIIVARHMIRGTSVPDLLIDKFYKNFSSLQFLVKKLDKESENKIFNRIRPRLFDSVKKIRFENKDDLTESIKLANTLLDFIKVWKKSLSDFPIIVELVKKIMVQSNIVNLDNEVINLYNKEKKWRRIFFNETLLVDRSESAYMNILKHNAMVLPEHHVQLDKVIKLDNMKYKKYFSKLRLYFHNDLALNYRSLFEKKLEACHMETNGIKSVVFTICILTEKDRFDSLIQKYIPQEYKVVWSTEDPCILNLRKNFARYMHLVQPTVAIENVLAFTKGDYLQYAIPSLLSVCTRITTEECKTLIPKLLEGAISVQKLGIRLAFLKLPIDEVTKLFVELWDSTSNASIRALIFKLIFELLCKEKKEKKILELWELLKVFVEKLSSEEDRSIYPVLAQVEQVPASIRPQFCMISYDCLKSVPEKFNCNRLVSLVTREIVKLCKDIDEEFVMKIIMQFIQECFVNRGLVKNTNLFDNSAAEKLIFNYLLYCDNLEMQQIHFEKVAKPIMSQYKSLWNETKDHKFVAQEHLASFVRLFINRSHELAIDRQINYVTPKLIFNMLLAEIEIFAPLEDYFQLNVYLKLAYLYHDSLETVKIQNNNYKEIEDQSKYISCLYEAAGDLYGSQCGELLLEFADNYYTALEYAFVEVVKSFLFDCIDMQTFNEGVFFKFAMVNSLLDQKSNYKKKVMAIRILPCEYYEDQTKAKQYFGNIFEKLKLIENREVRFAFKQKFSQSLDFYMN